MKAVPLWGYIAYDGTNSADVLDFINDHDTQVWDIGSEVDGVLTLHAVIDESDEFYVLDVGGAIVTSPSGNGAEGLLSTDFTDQFARYPEDF